MYNKALMVCRVNIYMKVEQSQILFVPMNAHNTYRLNEKELKEMLLNLKEIQDDLKELKFE